MLQPQLALGNGYTRLRYGAPVHVTDVHLEFRPEQVVCALENCSE